MKIALAALALAATSLAAATAFADDGDSYNILEDDGADYSVEFFIDSIDAGNNDPNGDRIVVRPMGVRRTLLRPRTSFVRALIRSVEQL
jgi:hypothetical protein